MAEVWLASLASVVVVSLLSLVGVATFFLSRYSLERIVYLLVSFSAGALLGDALIHLLPEAVEEQGMTMAVSLSVIAGIMVSFVIEKAIRWRHCHVPTSEDHVHSFAYMNLFGDGVHNFIDGLIIGASYLVSLPLGAITTMAIVSHEIPQEIGDFGVLIHGGFDRKRALLLNLASATVAIAGTLIALLVGSQREVLTAFLIPFAAGGFIYIAGADLMPEIHKECEVRPSISQFVSLCLGFLFMVLLVFLE